MIYANSLRSLAGDAEVFALEQTPPKPTRRKGSERTPYAGSLVLKAPPPHAVEGDALCAAIWALCERHDAKPPGCTFTGWRAKSRGAAREIIASGLSVQAAVDAWERCLHERHRPLYSIFALQGEIARQAADDRDRGGGCSPAMGYTDAELDEE